MYKFLLVRLDGYNSVLYLFYYRLFVLYDDGWWIPFLCEKPCKHQRNNDDACSSVHWNAHTSTTGRTIDREKDVPAQKKRERETKFDYCLHA